MTDYNARIQIRDALRDIAMVAWAVAYHRINGWEPPVWEIAQ
jgi:hypothetical protein